MLTDRGLGTPARGQGRMLPAGTVGSGRAFQNIDRAQVHEEPCLMLETLLAFSAPREASEVSRATWIDLTTLWLGQRDAAPR